MEGDNGSAFLGGILGGLPAVAERNMNGEPGNEFGDIGCLLDLFTFIRFTVT